MMEIRFRFAHVIYGYRIALKLRSQTEFSQCTKYVHRVSLYMYTVFVEHLSYLTVIRLLIFLVR